MLPNSHLLTNFKKSKRNNKLKNVLWGKMFLFFLPQYYINGGQREKQKKNKTRLLENAHLFLHYGEQKMASTTFFFYKNFVSGKKKKKVIKLNIEMISSKKISVALNIRYAHHRDLLTKSIIWGFLSTAKPKKLENKKK